MANKPRSPARASKKIEKARAEIGDAGTALKRAAKVVEANNDEHLAELIKMFKRNQYLCRQLETRCREKLETRDLYALMQMFSQQREIIADIRACSDLSQQANLIIDGALKPMGQELLANINALFYQLRNLLKETTDPKQTQFAQRELERVVKDFGSLTQTAYETAESKINQTLLG